ncbi:hypothetical protein [Halorientalis pallida]|uniref:Uncharacterized protein n=1 Tax=Halorientalis pallida TaxID=2479928 RepID=A0A498KZ51_9EURY|nr:hypothetical protein [Halorientalis pallida]RXK51320.1 hypothetical protein EAF64_01365 [Halorientalis pallida]
MTGNRTEESRRGGPITRRRVLATAGVATGGALAGCTGDSGGGTPTDDGDDGNDDSDDDGGTPTDTGPQMSGGIEVAGESTVDPLVVDGLERQGGNENKVVIVTTVRNAGEQTTDIVEYSYDLVLFDADGAEMGTNTGFGTTGDTEVAPGEAATINVSKSVEGDVSAVARAEVTLSCEGMFAEGVYCES